MRCSHFSRGFAARLCSRRRSHKGTAAMSPTAAASTCLVISHCLPRHHGTPDERRVWRLLNLVEAGHAVRLVCPFVGRVHLRDWRELSSRVDRIELVNPGVGARMSRLFLQGVTSSLARSLQSAAADMIDTTTAAVAVSHPSLAPLAASLRPTHRICDFAAALRTDAVAGKAVHVQAQAPSVAATADNAEDEGGRKGTRAATDFTWNMFVSRRRLSADLVSCERAAALLHAAGDVLLVRRQQDAFRYADANARLVVLHDAGQVDHATKVVWSQTPAHARVSINVMVRDLGNLAKAS